MHVYYSRSTIAYEQKKTPKLCSSFEAKGFNKQIVKIKKLFSFLKGTPKETKRSTAQDTKESSRQKESTDKKEHQ